jgi:predicted metal-dependent phosphoesterase TrpH
VEIVKCDLHVHSYFSGLCTTPFVRKFCRESYSDPADVYAQLKQRGMDLFTLTDHDSVEGAEQLRQHPDFFVSEELTCRMPSGTEIHVGVYNMNERQHAQLQQRRNDLIALLMYLTQRRLFFSINHVFSSLTGVRKHEDFLWFEKYFPAVETLNSHMLETQNQHAASLAARWQKIAIGGSDAHALPSVGTAYTEVPGARNKDEFFEGLRRGLGRVAGESGSFPKLTRDVFLIAIELMREKSWTALLSPLALFIPVVTLLNYRDEATFCRRWGPRLLGWPQTRKRTRWIGVPARTVEDCI